MNDKKARNSKSFKTTSPVPSPAFTPTSNHHPPQATAKRAEAEKEAARCSDRLALANRLVNGLASENERWGNEVAALHAREKRLIGDTLLAAG